MVLLIPLNWKNVAERNLLLVLVTIAQKMVTSSAEVDTELNQKKGIFCCNILKQKPMLSKPFPTSIKINEEIKFVIDEFFYNLAINHVSFIMEVFTNCYSRFKIRRAKTI